MLRLGLTGSIATGKSTTLRAFADLGVPVFSADEAVHQLYADEAVAPVEAVFPGVVRGGIVDRDELSRQLLQHPEKLPRLEAVVHPLVRRRIAAFFAAAEAAGAALAVVDIPLLFENGVDWGLDAVAVTVVDAAEQRRRALSRPGMTVEKLDAILARQMPQEEKKERADYVFDTAGPIEATRQAVREMVGDLLAADRGTT